MRILPYFSYMKSKIARLLLGLWGWRIEGEYPIAYPKNVVAVVPHTSWIDFPLGILVRSSRKMPTRFLAKKSLFRWPLGSLFRWFGGYPVDRSGRKNMTDTVVDIFNEHDRFDIAIAPEGTRKKVSQLRTGFYWIARKANAAIIMTRFDYEKKVVFFSAPFFPTEDAEADIRKIEKHFKGTVGKKREYSFGVEEN
jgi:1-acyl-sn-glycerol-3-phosphate acyltransferase